MNTAVKMIAAKYDIIRSKISGEEFVVEGHSRHVSGVLFLCVCLKDGRSAALFERDFTLVKRDPQNLHYDIGFSELATKTTHAVAFANASHHAQW